MLRVHRLACEALVQNSSDLLSVHDRDGTVVFVNSTSQLLLGVPPEHVVGSNPFRLVHPDDRDHVVAAMLELRDRPGGLRALTLRARHADGQYRYLETMVCNGLDDPSLQGVLVSTRDVTDRTLAQETLSVSESRHRQLVECVPVGLAVVDANGLLRFANPTAVALTGLATQAAALGRPVVDFVGEPDRERCAAAVRTALVDRLVAPPSEYVLVRPGGDVVVTSAPMPYEWQGEPAALLVLQDVTELNLAHQQRRQAGERLRGILTATAEGIVGLDAGGRITFMNPAAANMLGLDPEAVLGQPAHRLYHHSRPDGSPYPEHECPVLQTMRTGRPAVVADEVLWHRDGSPLPVEYMATPMPEGSGSGVVLAFHDISERLRSREQVARVASFQRSVLDALPALTAVVDNRGVIVDVNSAWTRHAQERDGTSEGSGVGVSFLTICEATTGPARPGALAVAAGLCALLSGELATFEQDVACELPNGDTTYFSLLMVPLDATGSGVVIAYTDITARKQLEVSAAHRATHDVLTGLPNRALLLDRLERALSVRGEHSVALLFLDLDGFKLVNDGYGHEAGDTVLRLLAERLREHVRPSDTVARLSGDEFVVLCEDLGQPSEAYVLADRLIAAVGKPFPVQTTALTLGVSIGIAVASEPHTGPDALLRAADQAMFDAKAGGRNRFVVYDAGAQGRHHVRLEQAAALQRLVDEDNLLVHYQPVVDLRTGRLVGAEALLRWRGTSPLPDTATAVGLAAEIGLIADIDRHVLREAIVQAATFVRPDGSRLPVAVNLSAQHLDHDLVALVQSVAQAADYPLGALTIELTERSLMTDPHRAVDVLRELRSAGVRIALDNFGVGYSSLAALNALPLDVLKIDAAFVRRLPDGAHSGRVITATVELARAFGLDLIAEGVDRPEQRDRLVDLGCDTGQGWLYSRALPASALRKLVG